LEYNVRVDSLRDFLRILYKHKLVILIVFVTVMATVYIGQQMKTPRYKASVKMLVTGKMSKDLEYQRSLGPGSLTDTQMELVTSKKVIERAVRALKLYERPLDYEKRYASWLKRIFIERNVRKMKEEIEMMAQEERKAFYFSRAVAILTNSISTSKASENSSIFLITAKDFNPREAIKMANVVSRSYVIFDLETQIAELNLIYGEMNPTILKLRNFINRLEESLDGRIISDLDALGPASVKIISQAESAQLVMGGGVLNLYIIGFILSILSGIVLSFGLEYIDQTVKGPKDVDNFKIPFIGSIPKRKKKDMLIMNNPASDKLECVRAFQRVGDKILLYTKERGIKTVLVNSISRPFDTSTLTANLGIYLARDTGKRILIIDGNLGFQSMSDILGINANPDIVDLFEGKCALKDAIKDIGDNLYLLPSRKVQFRPIKLIDSPFMANLIKDLKEQFDLILVDCQLKLLNDVGPVILSSYVDAVMMVLSEGEDRYYQVGLTLNILRQRNGINIFSVLNNRKKDLPRLLQKIA
jgi:capsular polysaccharide biosynthesis protein/Mrp family chromosome partitioning ATPase